MISDVHNALHVEILCKSTCIVQNDGIDLDEPRIHVKAVWDNNNFQSFNDFLNIENIARLNDNQEKKFYNSTLADLEIYYHLLTSIYYKNSLNLTMSLVTKYYP